MLYGSDRWNYPRLLLAPLLVTPRSPFGWPRELGGNCRPLRPGQRPCFAACQRQDDGPDPDLPGGSPAGSADLWLRCGRDADGNCMAAGVRCLQRGYQHGLTGSQGHSWRRRLGAVWRSIQDSKSFAIHRRGRPSAGDGQDALGRDDHSVGAPFFAREFEQAGIAGVTIHGRTRDAGIRRQCQTRRYPRVVDSVEHIPVIGNGDIRNVHDAARMFTKTGCDGIAIGRGACSIRGYSHNFAAGKKPATGAGTGLCTAR